jgi:ribosomal protein S12 methylthiotransferase accessory factor
MLEALSAAICEVIERDAASIWGEHDIRRQTAHHLDTGSIDDPAARDLLDRYAAAGVSVRLWNVTSDVGIAAFVCDIREMSDDPGLGMRRFRGAGCHPDRSVALTRALTEAAQTRLTYIVGSRDDIPPEEYAPVPDASVAEALLDVLQQASAPHDFGEIPNFVSDDIAEDVAWQLVRLRAVGIARVVAVDLTQPALGIPVVRVVVPGLEGDCRNAEYVPGLRALRAAGRA